MPTETDVEPTPLPCPFCGSENLNDSVSHIDLTYLCAIRCRECKTRAPTGEHVHQKHPLAKQQAYRSAVENWNQIAAAPDLLDELHDLVDTAESAVGWLRDARAGRLANHLEEQVMSAKAAITKARGEADG